MHKLPGQTILFRGAGDLATGAALRLYRAGLRRLVFLETPQPMAVRRTVCFSEAVYTGSCTVEEVTATLVRENTDQKQANAELEKIWAAGQVAVIVDPAGNSLSHILPDVEIEATLSKKNIGVTPADAPLVIGLGPGFTAPHDVHCVIETNRGFNLGRLIRSGSATPNTGIPGTVMGYNVERVLRAPANGIFETSYDIGTPVAAGDYIGAVAKIPVVAEISGTLRGLLRNGTHVTQGTKIGDIEPRAQVGFHLVSDKSLALGGAILEAILAKEIME